MTHILQVLVALMTVCTAVKGLSITQKITSGVTKEISAVKTPIDETIAYIGSSQCATVKKLVGVEYDQIKDGKEPDLNQLTFHYTTRGSKSVLNITTAPELITEMPGYDHDKKLIVYIHGFIDDPTHSSYKTISEAFLSQNDGHILALDGSSLIRWLYLRSSTYIRFMGEKVGAVLAAVYKSGLKPELIHLIGHSLGSHISGFAGKTFRNLTGVNVGRISGLDPAGPCFTHVDPELRLLDTDADFVDAIHTDAGVYGLTDPVGHADFYPNGGSQQPNCLTQTCSHLRAWVLYAESIVQHDSFPAVKCKDWAAYKTGQCDQETQLMGYACSSDARGLYYLRTAERSPYGLGKEGTVYENNEGIIRNVGSIGAGLLQKL